MEKRSFWPKAIRTLVALICPLVALTAQGLQTRFNDFAIPKDFLIEGKMRHKGNYFVALFNLNNSPRWFLMSTDEQGGVSGTDLIMAEESSDICFDKPKAEVKLIQSNSASSIIIQAYQGNHIYKARLECPRDEPAKVFSGVFDVATQAEMDLLVETHALVRKFGELVWPGWKGCEDLAFSITLPNHLELHLSNADRVPPAYERVPSKVIGGKAVYIDRSQVTPGLISGISGLRGDTDAEEAHITLFGELKAVEVGNDRLVPSATLSIGMDFMQIFQLIHESFHKHQRNVVFGQNSSRPAVMPWSEKFPINEDVQFFSDAEGRLLCRAYLETNPSFGLQLFKEAIVARKMKHQAMSKAAVMQDVDYTTAEGLATYASIRVATLLIRDEKYEFEIPRYSKDRIEVYGYIDQYISENTSKMMLSLDGLDANNIKRTYYYGACWALLLDRYCPGYKTGLLEKSRTLDEVIFNQIKINDSEMSDIVKTIRAVSAPLMDTAESPGQD